jgi:thiaminase/transcriptional activator TenA
MSLTEDLRRRVEPLWERMVNHPFVKELGDGTLPADIFRRYFLQDYLFVRDLSRLLALAIAKAPDFPSARRLSGFLGLVLTGEEELFQRSFRRMGIPREEVERIEPSPTYLAYASYLLRLGYEGSYEEILTALLCIEWTYLDWAKRLVAAGKQPQEPAYREWIEIHSSGELEGFVGWMRESLDRLPAPTPRMEEIFLTALRYEYLFWEMAYRGERWPE